MKIALVLQPFSAARPAPMPLSPLYRSPCPAAPLQLHDPLGCTCAAAQVDKYMEKPTLTTEAPRTQMAPPPCIPLSLYTCMAMPAASGP